MKKIYQAKGLLEYQMTLTLGGANIRICFSGGTMGSNGVQGGTYVTDNPLIQALIEATPQYCDNRITCRVFKEPKEPGNKQNRI